MIHYNGIFSIEELIQISGKILAKPCLSMVQNEFEKNQLMRTTSDSSYIKCNMFSFTYLAIQGRVIPPVPLEDSFEFSPRRIRVKEEFNG